MARITSLIAPIAKAIRAALTPVVPRITSLMAPIAKAIVAALMPVVLVVAAWLVDNLGVNVAVDVEALELAVAGVLSGVVVYLFPNRTADTPEGN